MNDAHQATIFDIQGYSVHDGPGGRTLIFFKGCPLSCKWCCNPEGIHPYIELMHRKAKCIRCKNCAAYCPEGAISYDHETGFPVFDRKKCSACTTHACRHGCYYQAIAVAGKKYTLAEVLRKIERDRPYWRGEGGVTLGGGEVMTQYKFAAEVLKACHEMCIHTAIETSGCAPWEHYEALLPYLDWIFADLKHMDPEMHKKFTGVSNGLIKSNLAKLGLNQKNYRMVLRIPVIPGFNDTEENMEASAEFMLENNIREVNLLPFHRLGASKYDQLGLQYGYAEVKTLEAANLETLQNIFSQKGLSCYLGSETPF